MRSKRQFEGMVLAGQVLQRVADEDHAANWLDRVMRDLEARGLSREDAERLALQLCKARRFEEMTPDRYESLLDGVSLACNACEVDAEHAPEPAESVGRVREIERMMQSFAAELSKLDESLEVLSAYVRRMREQPAARPRGVGSKTLH